MRSCLPNKKNLRIFNSTKDVSSLHTHRKKNSKNKSLQTGHESIEGESGREAQSRSNMNSLIVNLTAVRSVK